MCRKNLILKIAVLLITAFVCTVVRAEDEQPPQQFLNFIKSLADEGNLTDIKNVEKTLQTKLKLSQHISNVPASATCAGGGIKVFDQDIYQAMSDFWFKAPAKQGVSPEFSYEIQHTEICPRGPIASSPTVSANIVFKNLPLFVCITKDELVYTMPEAQQDPKYAGMIDKLQYITAQNKNDGVVAEFMIPDASGCYQSVSVFQDKMFRIGATR